MFQYKFNWAKKVSQASIQKLYEADTTLFKDDKLIDEVGWGLYARCMSIITVTNAYEEKSLPCPNCEEKMEFTPDPRQFSCVCGLVIPWEDFKRSYKNKQLYGANAMPIFTKFVNNFPQCKDYDQKMLAIDALINAFHILHSYRTGTFTETPSESDPLGRPVGANLIEGSLYEVIEFLDFLSNR